jgi:uncharacterized protein YegL
MENEDQNKKADDNDSRELDIPEKTKSTISRTIQVIWICDCSDSMKRSGIAKLNHIIQESIPHVKEYSENNPGFNIYLRGLKFSQKSEWINNEPELAQNYEWHELATSPRSDFGNALRVITSEYKTENYIPTAESNVRLIFVLVSDGYPTDEWEEPMKEFLANPVCNDAIRLVVPVKDDTNIPMDENLFTRFIGGTEKKEEHLIDTENSLFLLKFFE